MIEKVNFNEFFSTEKRNVNEIEKLQTWLLPKNDRGLWYSYEYPGPVTDWINSHSKKWFKYIKNNRVCIQAGGAIGIYPRMLAQKFQSVYTFEPHPVLFFCLSYNCRIENIIKLQATLGEKNELVGMDYDIDPLNFGMTKVSSDKNCNKVIPMLTIDSMNIQNVDLIALDVEGYEYNILVGAKKTIEHFHPVIIAENSDNNKFRDLLAGYKLVDTSASDSIWVYNI